MSLLFSILKRDGKYWLESSKIFTNEDGELYTKHMFKREDGNRAFFVEVNKGFMRYDR